MRRSLERVPRKAFCPIAPTSLGTGHGRRADPPSRRLPPNRVARRCGPATNAYVRTVDGLLLPACG